MHGWPLAVSMQASLKDRMGAGPSIGVMMWNRIRGAVCACVAAVERLSVAVHMSAVPKAVSNPPPTAALSLGDPQATPGPTLPGW